MEEFTTAGRALALFGVLVGLGVLFAPFAALDGLSARRGAAGVAVLAILVGAAVVTLGG